MANAPVQPGANAQAPGVNVPAILERLAEMYPDARCALHFTTPFELLVACILSAQCTDKRVNIVTARLFPRCNRPEHFAAMTPEELAEEIRDCGLYRSKARHIVELSQILLDRYDGQVPQSREELMQLPGVGRKTANVVLSNAFGRPAIAVDTHVFRVANRIGLASADDPFKTELQLMDAIPESLWSQAHHWLIHHGRNLCSARNPRCHACPIQPYCRYAAERTGTPPVEAGTPMERAAAQTEQADTRRQPAAAQTGANRASRPGKPATEPRRQRRAPAAQGAARGEAVAP
ncbi:MAG TPA: endonuclease III [Limnochordales bacterium]